MTSCGIAVGKGFMANIQCHCWQDTSRDFGSLMWIVRWWRQSDILRKSRFSVWSIAWTVAMAGLVQGIVFLPNTMVLHLGKA